MSAIKITTILLLVAAAMCVTISASNTSSNISQEPNTTTPADQCTVHQEQLFLLLERRAALADKFIRAESDCAEAEKALTQAKAQALRELEGYDHRPRGAGPRYKALLERVRILEGTTTYMEAVLIRLDEEAKRADQEILVIQNSIAGMGCA